MKKPCAINTRKKNILQIIPNLSQKLVAHTNKSKKREDILYMNINSHKQLIWSIV